MDWVHISYCFNLGIEMLFVSSLLFGNGSQSSYCFNLGIEMLFVSRMTIIRDGPLWYFANPVSISESRCFSFQVLPLKDCTEPPSCMFQSRNRDAFRFKDNCRGRTGSIFIVSISESRCFSFQVRPFGSLTVRALIGSDSARDTFQDARR